MAGSVNKVILVGNLGKDPEVRHTQDGKPIVNLSAGVGLQAQLKLAWTGAEAGEGQRACGLELGLGVLPGRWMWEKTAGMAGGQPRWHPEEIGRRRLGAEEVRRDAIKGGSRGADVQKQQKRVMGN